MREFGSLAELIDRVDEVKGKAGDALRAHLSGVLLNRQLTELVRDVPLDVEPGRSRPCAPWDRDAVHRLFDELEFRVLRERLFATLQSAEPEAEGGIEVQGGAIPPGGLRAWLDEHARDGRRVGVWPSTASSAPPRRPTWRASAWPRASRPSRPGRPERRRVFRRPATSTSPRSRPDDEAALGEWLADPAVPKAAHDVKAALHALRGRGWSLAGLTSDTALAAYLARPGQRSFDLADLALRYLRRELRAEAGDGRGRRQLSLRRRCGRGRRPTRRERADGRGLGGRGAGRRARRRARREGGSELLAELELPLEYVLADLETAGIAVDHELLSSLEARVRRAR